MRKAVHGVAVHPHLLEEIGGKLLCLCFREALIDNRGLGDDLPDRHAGVERRVRILEDRLDGLPIVAEFPSIQQIDVLPLEFDHSFGWRLDKQQQLRQGCLATPGLANQAERATPRNREVGTIHGLNVTDNVPSDHPRRHRVVLLETADAQNRLRLVHRYQLPGKRQAA